MVFDGFLSIFLYFGLVEGIKSQETMLLKHHNFSLPIRKSRGFAVGKTHWGESKAGVVHVHILAVSFQGDYTKGKIEYLYNLYSKPDAYAYT